MGTTHGAEELGLCFHGLASQDDARGRHHRVMPRVWPNLEIQTNKGRQKYSARLVTFCHDEILTNVFLLLNCGTLQMRIAVSRDLCEQRVRELSA